MAIILNEKEDYEFKQLVLLAVLALWLAAEYLYMDWHMPIKFRIMRFIYWTFMGTVRIDVPDDPEGLDQYWSFIWKCIKVLFADFFCMIFVVWAFGRSIMYPISILECAWILAIMFLPERMYSPHKTFLWHITLR